MNGVNKISMMFIEDPALCFMPGSLLHVGGCGINASLSADFREVIAAGALSLASENFSRVARVNAYGARCSCYAIKYLIEL